MATKKTPVKATPAKQATAVTRRPPGTPDLPIDDIDGLGTTLLGIRNQLEAHAAHLRTLDRKRLNGVGIKKLGFIERAYELALDNTEFLPHYLTMVKFGTDRKYFFALRAVSDITRQIQELLWNLMIEASDVLYTDALEFYASVREASKRRVDAAESIHDELKIFFKSRGHHLAEEPTAKQLKRDANALISGRRDGKIVIENVKPHLTGGKHKVIDEKWSDTAAFRDTIGGQVED